MCRDVFLSLAVMFPEGNPYYPVIKEIIDVHRSIDKLYDEMGQNITALHKHTQQWDKLFEEAKANIHQREAIRRVYDHYDEKFEKLVRLRNDRATKNIPESQKETERFDRVHNA